MAQLTAWSPIFCRILRYFATKEMSAQPGIRTPNLLHVKPVCYHYATATSCNIELKVGSLNHLKYSLVSNFLSEINKAISYFIYLLNTLTFALLIDYQNVICTIILSFGFHFEIGICYVVYWSLDLFRKVL